MKSLIVIIFCGLVSMVFFPSEPKSNLNIEESDSITQLGIETIQKSIPIYEAEKDYLCGSLSLVGDNHSSDIAEVRSNRDTVYKTRTLIKYIKKPVYYKEVYTIYTPRGYHIKVDTFKISSFK